MLAFYCIIISPFWSSISKCNIIVFDDSLTKVIWLLINLQLSSRLFFILVFKLSFKQPSKRPSKQPSKLFSKQAFR